MDHSGAAARSGDFPLLGRLLRQARPWWGALLLSLGLSLLAAPLSLLVPLPFKVVVDSVLGETKLPGWLLAISPAVGDLSREALLLWAAVAVAVFTIVVQAQAFVSWVHQTWVGQHLVLEFRARLFEHLQALSLAWHRQGKSADTVYRVQVDAPSIQSVAIDGLIPFLTACVKVAVLLLAIWRLDATIAFVLLAGGPLLLGPTELWRARLRKRWSALKAEESAAMGVVQESLGAVQVVKAFGQEARESQRYRRAGDKGVQAAVSAVRAHGSFELLVSVLTGVGGAVILWLGAHHVMSQRITLGDLILVLAYLSAVFQPLREMGTRLAALQSALAGAERAFAILDQAPEAPDRPDARPLVRARGAIRFENVTAGYEEGFPVLQGVTFQVGAGQRVGIAGPTGSGKSTLVGLLPRFHDAKSGRILLDGQDVRDLRLKDLRRQFAVMLQEPILFSTSVRENIAYGRPEATTSEIEAAAVAAAAHDFILSLPAGYQTNAGERGLRLSGGERQRIALARAFLRDAPILILDEPTSSLDRETESDVLRALEALMSGRTTFMIAHRLETLAGCDLRLRVEGGRVQLEGGPR